jgi:hypothetical protein
MTIIWLGTLTLFLRQTVETVYSLCHVLDGDRNEKT